jgi:2-hydroxy-3-keto-5-methylthiopentenyl-1-phosphate phosphatase
VRRDGVESVTAEEGRGAAAGPARTIVVDFDGKVTEGDLLDTMAQELGDSGVYAEVEDGLHRGELSLQDVITREFAPVRAPIDEAVEWTLERARVRPGFSELVELARERGWRLAVVSSGFHELIEPVLASVGVDVEVYANRVDARPDGWRVQWREERVCEVCGERCKRTLLRDIAPQGEVVYVGDGISDRCAALASDRVFAIRGLAEYLGASGVAYTGFRDFSDVAAALADSGASDLS